MIPAQYHGQGWAPAQYQGQGWAPERGTTEVVALVAPGVHDPVGSTIGELFAVMHFVEEIGLRQSQSQSGMDLKNLYLTCPLLDHKQAIM